MIHVLTSVFFEQSLHVGPEEGEAEVDVGQQSAVLSFSPADRRVLAACRTVARTKSGIKDNAGVLFRTTVAVGRRWCALG